MIPPLDAFARIVVALLVGVLIGIDRERAEVRKHHGLFAGIRTFPLFALAGVLPALLIDAAGPWLILVSFLALSALTVVAYYRSSAAGDVGATTETAAIVTFLLGVVVGFGHLLLAGATGIAVAILLVAKPPLEGFSRALSNEELAATLELAVISCIILPLLPNAPYGPWGVLNPFEIWLVVVLVSAVSFAGFVAMRLLGERKGLLIAGVVGAAVSTTAVTVAMANRTRDDPALGRAAATATILAAGVMCVRVAVFAAFAGIGILSRLWPVMVTMTATGLIAAWLLARVRTKRSPKAVGSRIANPFSIWAAATFGVLYAAVLLVVHVAQEFVGPSGAYLAAGLSALVDVDAITIALARAGPQAGGWREPAAAVTLALVVNTLVKLGIAVAMGEGEFRRHVTVALAVMSVLGAVAGAAVYLNP